MSTATENRDWLLSFANGYFYGNDAGQKTCFEHLYNLLYLTTRWRDTCKFGESRQAVEPMNGYKTVVIPDTPIFNNDSFMN